MVVKNPDGQRFLYIFCHKNTKTQIGLKSNPTKILINILLWDLVLS